MLPHEALQSQVQVERSLLSRVLGWLGLSLVLTTVGVYLSGYYTDQLVRLWWLVALGAFGLLIATQFAERSGRHPLAIGLFAAFAVTEGLFIGPVVLAYLQAQPDTVGNALLGTVGIFFVAASIVYMTSLNLAAWGKWLFGALIVGIIGSVAAIFIPFDRLLLDVFLGVVFIGLTFFDFWRVKAQRAGDNDALMLAISLYLDFLNLFLILLRLFGRGRN
jgi:FtsH-binding integral membrane protein